nr:hypothetical protein [Tanacetum cinerariifolium]
MWIMLHSFGWSTLPNHASFNQTSSAFVSSIYDIRSSSNHILTTHPNIPKRANEPHHMIANDDFVKFVFETGNFEARGTWIPVVLPNEDIMHTNAYKVYDTDFKKLVVPMTQDTILIVKQIDVKQMIEAKKLSYTLDLSAKEAEAQANVKLLEQCILDHEVNKIVEGDEGAVVEFVNSLNLSHEDPATRINLRSHKGRPKVVNVDDDNRNLYNEIKKSPEAQAGDPEMWALLKVKFKSSLDFPSDTCRLNAFCKRDHDDHFDDNPEGEMVRKGRRQLKGLRLQMSCHNIINENSKN